MGVKEKYKDMIYEETRIAERWYTVSTIGIGSSRNKTKSICFTITNMNGKCVLRNKKYSDIKSDLFLSIIDTVVNTCTYDFWKEYKEFK